MKISIVSVVPEIYKPFLQASLLKRAQEKKLIQVDLNPYFDFVQPKERIDAPIFGPGAGMLIRPQVIERAIDTQEKKYGKAYKIFFSPQGKKLNQCVVKNIVQKASECGHLMLLPARYEGIDARAEEYYADEIISVGDFVLMGGDLAAMMLLEASMRYVPGVVGKHESVEDESFSGPFVEYPHYTEPVDWKGMEVPEIIRSGHHGEIDKWRRQQSAKRTVFDHFDWLRSSKLTKPDIELSKKYIPPHYCALMHEQVLIGPEKEKGTTSVTSLDLHDIARSARTYGIEKYFIVTPLSDQQRVINRLLEFWQTDGKDYNIERYEAVKLVIIVDHLKDVMAQIEQIEGKKPIIVATSARETNHPREISFYDQDKVWSQNRPVLLVFGTGQGLDNDLVDQADYILKPVKGFSEYNHLSVRSAAAIIFDRWLGINEKDC